MRVKTEHFAESIAEDWGDLVDPRSEMYDDATGEFWLPVGAFDDNDSPFMTEAEHKLIRQKSRKIVRKNPYAENLLKNLVSWVIGKGHKYTVVARKNCDKTSKKRAAYLVTEVQTFLDDLLEMNRWGKRQKEAYRRYHRDGEVFYRIFHQPNGFSHFRFIEPGDVRTPSEFSSNSSSTFGIKTDRLDVETVLGYYVDEEFVDSNEVQHRKANVDMNVKRGLSSMYAVAANLNRGQQLLTNMSMLVQIQTSVAMIRKHDKTSQAVKNFATNSASATVNDPTTGETRRLKRFRPGTVLDTKKGTEYEFPSMGNDPGAPVAVLSAELRAIASANCLPEYMVGSDASNANYSSSMVAESPAVKYFDAEQAEVVELDLELFWNAIEHAVSVGRLPDDVMTLLEIEVEPPILVTRLPLPIAQANEIYIRNRIKSPQTIASEQGLDYRQEQKNWRDFEDQTDALDLPLPGDLHGNSSMPGSDADSELNDIMKITTAVASGNLPEEGAVMILRKMLKWKEEAIRALIPKPRLESPSSSQTPPKKGAPSKRLKVKRARPEAA